MNDDYDYYEDFDDPYFLEDDTLGVCPECGSGLENWGAVGDGDGCIGDEIGCPNCQEAVRRINVTCVDEDIYDE